MKNLMLACTLVLASCVSAAPGNVPLETNGAVVRTIERVLERTEEYITREDAPLDIPAEALGQIEAAILTARTMTAMPEASGDVLMVTMTGIMDLHDAMVMADADLEQLEREIYMEDTERLRSLFESVSIHASLVLN